jgi:UDP-3-O-[3-hydroxymyristoyl] glucosamine N-acyltransferase
MPFTVAELAELIAGTAAGDSTRLITGANSIESAGPTDLAFAANRKALDAAAASNAGCLLVPLSFDPQMELTVIRVSDPRAGFAKALEALHPPKRLPPGVHPSAVVAASAEIGANCHVGAFVSIGEHARIGDHCQIGPGCVVGDHVAIGNGSTLHARVTIYDRVTIGARVIIHSGCVIGADGFGFVLAGGHYEKFPQVGVVEIGDDVEMGANCCIDRAALGTTRIGDGSKIDNLVHIAHNCSIGRHVIVVAQTGFSGSVTVGDYALIGGQVGVGEKAKIEANAIVGGKAGVLTSQTVRAGEPVWGIPARPLRRHLKALAYVQKLPELNETIRELRQRVKDLESAGMQPELRAKSPR